MNALDIVEFVEIARTLGADPLELIGEFLAGGARKGRQPGRMRRIAR
jgi:hypothetical protein